MGPVRRGVLVTPLIDETWFHEIAGAWEVFRRTTVGIPYSPEFAKAKADLDRMLEVSDG